MMKIMMVMLLAVSVFSHYSHAVNKRDLKEFKCHFELAGGQSIVQRVVSKAKHGNSVATEMRRKPIFAKDGTTKLSVAKVVECVPAKADFTGVESRQLDEKTLS